MGSSLIIFLGTLLFIVIGVIVIRSAGGSPASRQAAKIAERVKRASERAQEDVLDENGDDKKSLRRERGDSSLPLLTKLFAKSEKVEELRARLARAGLEMTAERYLMYNTLAFALMSTLIMLATDKPMIFALLIGFIFGFGFPIFMLNFMIGKQTKNFLLLFPDAIDLIVRGLKAGLPATESMKMAGKEIDDPVGAVFRSISEKMALGVPLEKTLYDTARKYRITEFDFFVTSIVLQRETGGNLSEILGNLSEAMRQRLMMKMKIKAMSSEARASMYIIGALPFVVMGALMVMSPEYTDPLFNDYRGNIAGGIAIGMLGTGIYVMLRMAKFEI